MFNYNQTKWGFSVSTEIFKSHRAIVLPHQLLRLLTVWVCTAVILCPAHRAKWGLCHIPCSMHALYCAVHAVCCAVCCAVRAVCTVLALPCHALLYLPCHALCLACCAVLCVPCAVPCVPCVLFWPRSTTPRHLQEDSTGYRFRDKSFSWCSVSVYWAHVRLSQGHEDKTWASKALEFNGKHRQISGD